MASCFRGERSSFSQRLVRECDRDPQTLPNLHGADPAVLPVTCNLLLAPRYCPNTHAKINGATIVASLSTMYFGVVAASLPHVIFSFGTAPE